MKITERFVLGLLGTVVLTSIILFALDARNTISVNTSPNIGRNAKEANAAPSISTKEQPIVSQTQEMASNAPSDTRMSGQAGTLSANQNGKSKSVQDSTSASVPEKSADQPTADTFQTVTQDYFSDALFIGDSRTVGMQQSQLLPNATYYAKTGIGIGTILSDRIVNDSGTMVSVETALSRHSFGKVYIMIGINDISAGDVDWFREQYAKILEVVHQTQPEALIYIQGNIPMSYHTQDFNGSLNNQNLMLRNEASRAFADSKYIFYLDVDEIFADGNGNLASIYTSDGLHVSPDHYPLWVDYLLHHAIVH